MRKLLRAAFVLALIGTGVMGATAWAKRPPGGGGGGGGTGCPKDIQCLDVWDPVHLRGRDHLQQLLLCVPRLRARTLCPGEGETVEI